MGKKKGQVKEVQNAHAQRNNKKEEREARGAAKKDRDRSRHGGDGWRSDFRKFNDQIGIFDLYVKDRRAVSDQIEGHPNSHAEVRKKTVECLEENRPFFEPFIEDDVPFDRYISDMKKNGTWGGHLELQAMSLVYQVNIVIHQLDQPRWEVNNFGAEQRSIHLSYHRGDHYASIRNVGQPNGVPNVIITSRPARRANEEGPTPEEKLVMASTNVPLAVARHAIRECGGADYAIEYLIASNGQDYNLTEDSRDPESKQEIQEGAAEQEIPKTEDPTAREESPLDEKSKTKEDNQEGESERKEGDMKREKGPSEKVHINGDGEDRREREEPLVASLDIEEETPFPKEISQTRVNTLQDVLKDLDAQETILRHSMSNAKASVLDKIAIVLLSIEEQKEGYRREIALIQAALLNSDDEREEDTHEEGEAHEEGETSKERKPNMRRGPTRQQKKAEKRREKMERRRNADTASTKSSSKEQKDNGGENVLFMSKPSCSVSVGKIKPTSEMSTMGNTVSVHKLRRQSSETCDMNLREVQESTGLSQKPLKGALRKTSPSTSRYMLDITAPSTQTMDMLTDQTLRSLLNDIDPTTTLFEGFNSFGTNMSEEN
ncbi:hypothetical protein PROFUN_02233 [Planoprotostelium fungivorum]|uniref:OTU domain-containing protein n=1 Tax=Planoprotostelium fungivorum TaxID=1890364 RepID=A0A2P6NYC4_9EUKA|nr:hypothetical protein PROFUN_02233 [Planoprotostelium fungivorum]